jgi:hypothetical protein
MSMSIMPHGSGSEAHDRPVAARAHVAHQHAPPADELPGVRLLIRRERRDRIAQIRVHGIALLLHRRAQLRRRAFVMAHSRIATVELRVQRIEARAHGFMSIRRAPGDRREFHDLLVGELQRTGARQEKLYARSTHLRAQWQRGYQRSRAQHASH